MPRRAGFTSLRFAPPTCKSCICSPDTQTLNITLETLSGTCSAYKKWAGGSRPAPNTISRGLLLDFALPFGTRLGTCLSSWLMCSKSPATQALWVSFLLSLNDKACNAGITLFQPHLSTGRTVIIVVFARVTFSSRTGCRVGSRVGFRLSALRTQQPGLWGYTPGVCFYVYFMTRLFCL